MGRSWLLSSLLHTALVAVLWFGLPSWGRPLPAMDSAITVELVSELPEDPGRPRPRSPRSRPNPSAKRRARTRPRPRRGRNRSRSPSRNPKGARARPEPVVDRAAPEA